MKPKKRIQEKSATILIVENINENLQSASSLAY